MEFEVRDGANVHRAFVFGGVGRTFSDVAQGQAYLRSVRRIRAMAQGPVPISVNLPNHPGAGGVRSRREGLVSRSVGKKHPYLDPAAFLAWLDQLESQAEERLASLRALRQ